MPNRLPKKIKSRTGDNLVRFGLRLPEELHKRLQADAREQHRSLHAHFLHIIEFYFETTTGFSELDRVIEQRHNLRNK